MAATLVEDTTRESRTAGILEGTKVYESTGHAIYKCRIKTCSNVERIDFTTRKFVSLYAANNHAYGTASQGRRVTSVQYTVNGVTRVDVLPSFRCKCQPQEPSYPIMGSFHGKIVAGTVVETRRCDFRCEGATGNVCECSCGGENHGGRYAITTREI